jgi:hypothetical protein
MKDILNQIKTFDGVFTKEQFDQIHKVLKGPIWHKNNSRPDAESAFWGIGDLHNHEYFSSDLMDHIRTIIGSEFKLDHILVNSQSTLQDGEPHYDNYQKNGYTFMVYMNPVWDIQWGGMTVFLDRFVDENKNIVVNDQKRNRCIFPVPNMGVLFPSNIIHFALGPNRKFGGQRITVAYKLYTGDVFETINDLYKNGKYPAP